MQKCVPVLLYGLELCALPTRTLQALDSTTNRFLMKLFKTFNIEIIEECKYFSMSNCHQYSFRNVFRKYSFKYDSIIWSLKVVLFG